MPHFDWHSLLIVASTLCSAFYQLFSRRYGQTERPDASATMATIVGTCRRLAAAAVRMGDAGVRLGLGRCSSAWASWPGIGHYFLTIAYSQAPAAVVAPFNYAQLIGAAILGYLVFDSIPDFWTWVGAAVIVCSGLLSRPCRAAALLAARRTRFDHLTKI